MPELEQSLEQPGLLLPVWRTILWAFVAYLVALGVTIFWRPDLGRSFLAGFAASPGRNFLEAALRGLVGLAFIGGASATRLPIASLCIGLFLLVTALLMALLPRLHRSVARRATDLVAGMLPLFGLLSLGLAALVAWFITRL